MSSPPNRCHTSIKTNTSCMERKETKETLRCNRISYERRGAVVRNLSNDRRNKKATDWCQVAEKPRQQSLAAALKPNTQTHTRDEGAIGGYAYSTLVCRNALVRTFWVTSWRHWARLSGRGRIECSSRTQQLWGNPWKSFRSLIISASGCERKFQTLTTMYTTQSQSASQCWKP